MVMEDHRNSLKRDMTSVSNYFSTFYTTVLNFSYDCFDPSLNPVESHQFGLCAEEHIVTVKGHRMAMANQIYWLTFSLNIFHLKLWPEKLAHQK